MQMPTTWQGKHKVGSMSARQTTSTLSVLDQYRRIIGSRTYFPLWLGQLVSNFGDTLNYVALVILVLRLTGSGIAVSLTVVLEIVPVLLLAPVAGVVIDRFPRKAILIASDLVRAALAAGLALANSSIQVYVIVALFTCASVFFNPTVQAVTPGLVQSDLLLAANSVAWTTGRLVQIIASALAGGLIAWVGTGSAFLLNALTFVFSALMIARLKIPARAGEVDRSNKRGFSGWIGDAGEGLRYVRHDSFVLRLLLVQALASLSVGATGALLVVLAERQMHLPPEGFAWLLMAIGAGALIGPLLLGSFTRNYQDTRLLFVPYIIRGVGDVLLAIVSAPVALIVLFVYGLNTSTGMVVYSSLMQSHVPAEMRGRVFTLMDLTWNLMRLISLALGGVAAEWLGIAAVYYAGGSLLAMSGLFGLLLLGRHKFNRAEAAVDA
ncbi:MAG: MFS transporter [Chloroflexota bacterium]|nr:MFS transporter [Chloroflexota bacterium]